MLCSVPVLYRIVWVHCQCDFGLFLVLCALARCCCALCYADAWCGVGASYSVAWCCCVVEHSGTLVILLAVWIRLTFPMSAKERTEPPHRSTVDVHGPWNLSGFSRWKPFTSVLHEDSMSAVYENCQWAQSIGVAGNNCPWGKCHRNGPWKLSISPVHENCPWAVSMKTPWALWKLSMSGVLKTVHENCPWLRSIKTPWALSMKTVHNHSPRNGPLFHTGLIWKQDRTTWHHTELRLAFPPP